MVTFMLMLLPDEDRDRIGRLWAENGDSLIRWAYDRLGSTAAWADRYGFVLSWMGESADVDIMIRIAESLK